MLIPDQLNNQKSNSEDLMAIKNLNNKLEQFRFLLGMNTFMSPLADFGEYLASKILNFSLNSSRSNKGYDGICNKGIRYEIKTKEFSTNKIHSKKFRNKGINNPDIIVFVFLHISDKTKCYIDSKEIIFKDENSVTIKSNNPDFKNVIDYFSIIKVIPLIDQIFDAYYQYKEQIGLLKSLGVIRTNTAISGELGEYYFKNIFDVESFEFHNPGFDFKSKDGVRFELKTRQSCANNYDGSIVHCFTERCSFDGLEKKIKNKGFDTLVGCFLEYDYSLIGFVFIPIDEVENNIFRRVKGNNKPSFRYRWKFDEFIKRKEKKYIHLYQENP